jgi:hypothetical protein
MIYRRVLDWIIGFIDTLFTQLDSTGNYSAIADLHTLQFTVTHALGYSIFTSYILATDFSRSRCHFKSLLKSSFGGSIPSCHYSTTASSIQFLCSEAHILAGWRLETRLHYYSLKPPSLSLLTPRARTTQKTASLLLRRLVYCSVV